MRTVIIFITIHFSCAVNVFGQGDNYVLFSTTGDTLITRTSCYGKKEDTLTSYFVILKNNQSNLELISVFTLDEPGKNSIPCANFNLVHKDTIAKYNLTILGKLGLYPKRNLHIKSKVVGLENADINNQGYLLKRTIRHKFKTGWRTFHTEILHDLVIDKKEDVSQPRIKNIFGNSEINRYYLMIITEDEFINTDTKRKHTVNNHKKIIK